MKTIVLTFLAIAFFLNAKSQILFYEDFDGINGPTAGGAGTYTFPSGWFLRNVDNRTPAGAVAYVNEAWERREDFAFSVVDSAAFSTSWYSPAGASDDWMWTPLIGPVTANTVLSWNAVAYDPAYPDGYEVRIMTAASGPPTGGTGVMGNQITNSTQVFSIGAENSAWTPRSLSLAAYAGQSIYVGFRNASNDMFLLLIDDIKVETLINYDAQLLSTVSLTEYSQIPVPHVTPMNFSGDIRNIGVNALTNVALNIDVKNSSNVSVYNASSITAGLLAGATSAFTVAPFTPSIADNYTVRYNVSSTEVDQVHSNDTLYGYFTITDTVYARDAGAITGGLGIGAGNGGYLGQDFEVVTADELTSVTMYFTRGYTGRKCAAVIWDMLAGIPNAVVASTDTILYPDDSARLYTLDIYGGYVNLIPGRYAVTAVEFDSTLSLALTNGIFTTNRTWVNWPTNPFGGWANNEDFGGAFAKSYVLRPNFGIVCHIAASVGSTTDASCNGAFDGSATVTSTGEVGAVTYSWSPSVSTTATATNIGAGSYSVTITDAQGCPSTIGFVINEPVAIASSQTVTVCAGESFMVGSTVHTSSGVYVDNLVGMAANGCDSVVTTDLTVNAVIDVSTTLTVVTVSANASSGTFQWLDCGNGSSIVVGETNQSYTPLVSGNYAVVVTDNGCLDTSVCVNVSLIGINQQLASTEAFNIYPNPSSGTVTIKTSTAGMYTISNDLGQVVKAIELNAKNDYNITITDLSAGVYTISGTTTNRVVKQKLVIKK